MFSNKLSGKIKIAGAALSLAFGFILFSTISASAQFQNEDWRRDRRGDRRNDRWNDRWGNTDMRGIENLIRRVEQRTDRFVRKFDRALDNSPIDGSRREDRLNERARELENATDDLRRRFDRSDSLRATRGEVERVMRVASQIDRVIRRGRVGYSIENSWYGLRNELNALARAYNVRGL